MIGYHGFKIVQQMGDGSRYGVRLRYVDQEETLGIAHAVGKLEPHINSPFLLFLGDIFFVSHRLDDLINEFQKGNYGAVLATKIEHDPQAIMRNFAIVEEPETGLVRRVIEKPRHTVNKIKGCGLYMFGLEIFDAIRRTPRTAMRDEYEITDAIQILIDDGFNVKQLPVIDDDLNLTFPADLLQLNLKLLKENEYAVNVRQEDRVDDSLKLESTVIGQGVVLTGTGTVKNSVIFPGTEMEINGQVKNSIITPSHYIYCHDVKI